MQQLFASVYLQGGGWQRSSYVCCLVAVNINGNIDKAGLEPPLWQSRPKYYEGTKSTEVDGSWQHTEHSLCMWHPQASLTQANKREYNVYMQNVPNVCTKSNA